MYDTHYSLVNGKPCSVYTMSTEERDYLSQGTKEAMLKIGLCPQCGEAVKDLTLCRCHDAELAGDPSLRDIWWVAIPLDNADNDFYKLLRKDRERLRSKDNGEIRQERRQICPGVHTKDDVAAILAIQGGTCYFCDTDLSGKKYHVDHLTPVAEEGDEWPSNMAVTCMPCNMFKRARNEREFWERLKKERGAAAVSELRAKRRDQRKEKEKLTRARRRAVKEQVALFEKRLNEARGRGEEMEFAAKLDDDGINIWCDDLYISTLPCSHRQVATWAANDVADIAEAMLRLSKLLAPPI